MGPRLAAAPPAAARRSLQHHARRVRGTACRACSSPHMRSLGPPSLSARPRPSCWHSESLLCRYRDRVGGRLRVLAAAPPVASPGGCPTCGSHFSGPPLPGAHESRCVLLKLFYALKHCFMHFKTCIKLPYVWFVFCCIPQHSSRIGSQVHGTLFRCQQIFRNLKQRFSPGLQTNTIQ